HCRGHWSLLAWRNRQTRTAQDRMGKPVEVRVLSRAVWTSCRCCPDARSIGKLPICITGLLTRFSARRPAGLHQLREPFSPGSCESTLLFEGAVVFVPPDFLLAAQRAFISSESFLRPAAVRAPFFLAATGLLPPFSLAQRALAAAESLARVEGEK